MAKIYVSGLINTETTVRVAGFPIPYYPIDYPFFGVQTRVSGVAYNISKALLTLGDEVVLASLIGNDTQGDIISGQLKKDGLDESLIRRELPETASSVVLYDGEGKRQVYSDLKDIQERRYPCEEEAIAGCDLVVACNINFNRSLLQQAVQLKKIIATDVHVLSNVEDGYNREFLEAANLVFLSDEGLPCEPGEFMYRLFERYHTDILVMGRGNKGAMMYVKAEDAFYDLPCVPARQVVNTVGAGDALFSSFLHFYMKGMKPVEALWHAQVFASAKIETNGAAKGFIREEEVIVRRNSL